MRLSKCLCVYICTFMLICLQFGILKEKHKITHPNDQAIFTCYKVSFKKIFTPSSLLINGNANFIRKIFIAM
jgi:hypothetical protein